MATIKSAKKRIRQDRERRAHNRVQRSRLRTSIKKVRNATDAETALAAYREAAAMLDRLATRRLIHPNKAARDKSKLAKHIQTLGAQP